jgi:hypothetical protein
METLSEEWQKGPKKAKMAGRKDAKQKAGPRGQTEKNREKNREFRRNKERLQEERARNSPKGTATATARASDWKLKKKRKLRAWGCCMYPLALGGRAI